MTACTEPHPQKLPSNRDGEGQKGMTKGAQS